MKTQQISFPKCYNHVLPVQLSPVQPCVQLQLQMVKSSAPPFIQLNGHTDKQQQTTIFMQFYFIICILGKHDLFNSSAKFISTLYRTQGLVF